MALPRGFRLPYPSPLVRGRLVRRYKRFLVDVDLDDGPRVTAHTANTGRMTGCSAPGSPVYLSRADDPRRKYAYTLEIVDAGPSLVGINTLLPNRLFAGALARRAVPGLERLDRVQREVAVDPGTRIDLSARSEAGETAYIEVKNVTLVDPRGRALFPDAVTARGRKHLEVLEKLAGSGHRAVVLFAVQRTDARVLAPADDIDPAYGATLRAVVRRGVEALAFELRVDPAGVTLGSPLPVEI